MIAAGLELVCPRCRSSLSSAGPRVHCGSCDRNYPVIDGIPDLRLRPDPWIGLEDDRTKARRVLEATAGRDFEETVRAYWALTPTTPTAAAERFIGHVLRARDRSHQWLDSLGPDADASAAPWLDAGCGTGDLAAAAGPGVTVVGVDVALRWLVIAKKRLQEEGVAAHLVCANAEHLPFEDATFGRWFSLGLLEHCEDAGAVVREGTRVLRPGGVARLRTVNRYSPLPEPHVGVRWVGHLPRRFADRYVRWRTGHRYLHHHPLGPAALARRLRQAGLERVSVGAAPLLAAEAARLPEGTRRWAARYESARTKPGVARLLRWVTPMLEARAQAPRASAAYVST